MWPWSHKQWCSLGIYMYIHILYGGEFRNNVSDHVHESVKPETSIALSLVQWSYCEGNLNLSYTNPIRLCGRRTDYGCDSVTFTIHGVQYKQVCGRVRGYQFGSPDAFDEVHGNCPAPCTIDKPYVDGVSITHGDSPRKHIWTYSAGVYENITSTASCPCSCSIWKRNWNI